MTNWSLGQGDKKVKKKKRMKEKYIFKQTAKIFRFKKKPSSGATIKMEVKVKVRYK